MRPLVQSLTNKKKEEKRDRRISFREDAANCSILKLSFDIKIASEDKCNTIGHLGGLSFASGHLSLCCMYSAQHIRTMKIRNYVCTHCI